MPSLDRGHFGHSFRKKISKERVLASEPGGSMSPKESQKSEPERLR